jgi:protein involved in polysaccharide export with SLBB domain
MKILLKYAALVLLAASSPLIAQQAPEPVLAAAPAQEYHLSPLDKLTVSIEQDPIPGRAIEITVSSLYNLEVPVSRCCENAISINVRGKTLAEVESELKTKLEQDHYKKATIHLKLIERDQNRRAGQIWLRGAVKGNIVQLESGKPKSLWEALTQVGTTEFARLSRVRVDRVDPATGEVQKIYVDIEAVNKGERAKDIQLQDGDRITVSEKWFNL